MAIIYSRPVFVNFTRRSNNEPDDIMNDPADQIEYILDFDELVRIADRAYKETGIEIGVRANNRETWVEHRSAKELNTAGKFEIVAFGEEPTCYGENINRLAEFFEEELPACNVHFEEFWDSSHMPLDEERWADNVAEKERPQWAADNLRSRIGLSR